MNKFCIYLTTYLGEKLPKYYIGSTSLERIQEGYKGSVLSKKWKTIWDKELIQNPQLFQLEILETFFTREEALVKEKEYQLEHNVLRDGQWINESIAQPEGFFGRDVSGENNPMYGKGYKIKQAWEEGKYKNVSDKCSVSTQSQWNDPSQRKLKIDNMIGKTKSRKTLTEEQFRNMQKEKAKKAGLTVAKRIYYNGNMYVGWANFIKQTGISKHLFVKNKLGTFE